MPWQRNLLVKTLLAAVARSTSADGSAVDLQGTIHPLGREMKAVLDIGAVTGTTPTLNVKLQQSDTTTGADFADISGAAFTTQSTTGTTELHFRATKRYVRASAVLAGTSPNFTFGVYALTEKLVQ